MKTKVSISLLIVFLMYLFLGVIPAIASEYTEIQSQIGRLTRKLQATQSRDLVNPSNVLDKYTNMVTKEVFARDAYKAYEEAYKGSTEYHANANDFLREAIVANEEGKYGTARVWLMEANKAAQKSDIKWDQARELLTNPTYGAYTQAALNRDTTREVAAVAVDFVPGVGQVSEGIIWTANLVGNFAVDLQSKPWDEATIKAAADVLTKGLFMEKLPFLKGNSFDDVLKKQIPDALERLKFLTNLQKALTKNPNAKLELQKNLKDVLGKTLSAGGEKLTVDQIVKGAEINKEDINKLGELKNEGKNSDTVASKPGNQPVGTAINMVKKDIEDLEKSLIIKSGGKQVTEAEIDQELRRPYEEEKARNAQQAAQAAMDKKKASDAQRELEVKERDERWAEQDRKNEERWADLKNRVADQEKRLAEEKRIAVENRLAVEKEYEETNRELVLSNEKRLAEDAAWKKAKANQTVAQAIQDQFGPVLLEGPNAPSKFGTTISQDIQSQFGPVLGPVYSMPTPQTVKSNPSQYINLQPVPIDLASVGNQEQEQLRRQQKEADARWKAEEKRIADEASKAGGKWNAEKMRLDLEKRRTDDQWKADDKRIDDDEKKELDQAYIVQLPSGGWMPLSRDSQQVEQRKADIRTKYSEKRWALNDVRYKTRENWQAEERRIDEGKKRDEKNRLVAANRLAEEKRIAEEKLMAAQKKLADIEKNRIAMGGSSYANAQFRADYGWSIPRNINDSLHNIAMFDASKIFNQSFGAFSPYLNATQKALTRVDQQDAIHSVAHIDPGLPNLNVSQQTLANAFFSDNFSTGLGKWSSSSNAYTTTSFGPIVGPDGGYFAVIHTGLGSAADTGLLSKQLDLMAASNLAINFQHNFVTNEYPIWVGSIFNDSFIAEIHTPDGNTINLASQTVNSSAFTSVSNLPTNVLDHSSGGQTGWKTVSTTVSVPSGTAQLHFHVKDVGDKIWDSAGLISNVSIKSK